MNTRDQIINFLLSQNDQKDKIIEDLQKQVAEANKRLADSNKSEA